jgi:hypothetical protein
METKKQERRDEQETEKTRREPVLIEKMARRNGLARTRAKAKAKGSANKVVCSAELRGITAVLEGMLFDIQECRQ